MEEPETGATAPARDQDGAAAALLIIDMINTFDFEGGDALRARAVENQSYVIASAQGGKHENGRRTWGHSMVIDPWGEVLACVPEGEGVALAEFNPARLKQVREQLPALQHRVI